VTTITIHDLDAALIELLCKRAQANGRFMEDEAIAIIRAALDSTPQSGATLVAAIRAHVEEFGGIELELPPREAIREPPDFG